LQTAYFQTRQIVHPQILHSFETSFPHHQEHYSEMKKHLVILVLFVTSSTEVSKVLHKVSILVRNPPLEKT
jgi:hypothetical protein